ncbi:MAG: DUF2867 domain-containing protein [Gemmatimonadaceae bacterium]|nr:DUF2867 domain-containing protein [Gemmatimonadaceae bacterium]
MTASYPDEGVPGKVLTDRRVIVVEATTADAFRAVANLGGDNGWYAWNWLWKLRAWLDSLFGGVGMRRSGSRRAPLAIGDEVDFWRVEALVPNQLIRLRAEMSVPGDAWLEFDISSDGVRSTVRQTATFIPHGLFGRLYWFSVFPFHQLVFRGLLRGIARAALRDRRAS